MFNPPAPTFRSCSCLFGPQPCCCLSSLVALPGLAALSTAPLPPWTSHPAASPPWSCCLSASPLSWSQLGHHFQGKGKAEEERKKKEEALLFSIDCIFLKRSLTDKHLDDGLKKTSNEQKNYKYITKYAKSKGIVPRPVNPNNIINKGILKIKSLGAETRGIQRHSNLGMSCVGEGKEMQLPLK